MCHFSVMAVSQDRICGLNLEVEAFVTYPSLLLILFGAVLY